MARDQQTRDPAQRGTSAASSAIRDAVPPGRAAVVVTIERILAAAGRSSGGALVIDGIAGIGKTAVLQLAERAALARGFAVRRAVGVPIEADLPFGALAAVLAEHRRDPTLADRYPALHAAIGRGMSSVSTPASWLEVAGEALDLLSDDGRASPQLVIVDDVQWIDASSAAVFGHIARHGVADPIAVLIARRSDDRGVAPYTQELAGIAGNELALLNVEESIDALVRAGCPSAEAAKWAPRCGGLPLALSEVGRHRLSLSERDAVAAVLPTVYRSQIWSLPEASVDAVLALALADDLEVVRAVGGEAALIALRSAADVGVVQLGDDDDAPVARFRHPLLRAAALAAVAPERERAMHRSIAAALVDLGEADRAALHLAAAVTGPDESAATAMVTMAERTLARGALVESARAFRRAAALSADPDTRSTMLRRAADAAFDHGDAATAFPLIDEAIDAAADLGVNVDARSLRARMSLWTHSPGETVRQLLAIVDDVEDVDPSRAAAALATAAGVGYLEGDVRRAIERGRRAESLALQAGDTVTAFAASGSLAFSLCCAGEWQEWDERLQPLEPIMRALLETRSWAGVHLAELFGTTWVCAERWDLAEPLIRDLLHRTRTMGARLTVASTTLLLGSLCARQGRWDEAYALERPLLDETDVPPITLAWMRILVAQLSASMGKVDETRELIALGQPVAASAHVPLIVAMSHAVLGHLELSLGNVDVALAHLDTTAQLTERIGFVEPEHFLWHGDHLDALVRAGRREEAAERAEHLAKLGVVGERRWARGVADRVLAQLASDPDEADVLYERSLDALDSLGMPFEVARTLSARGTARDLIDARRLFLRLGAKVWADSRGGQEPGGPPTVSRADRESQQLLERLTPAERNVALAVASGRTNREIAAELHLSVKTVDHYLQQAYRRVGVKNRTELAMTITRAIAAPNR